MPKTKKKTLSATQLPSGSWRCRVYDGILKKQISFTAPTAEEAVMQAQQYKLTHESKPKSDISRTLGECMDMYISSKSNILSPVTISKYRNICNTQLSPDFLKLRLSKLTGIDLQNEINRLAGIYSPKTVYNANGLVSATVHTFRPEFAYRVTLPRREKKKKALPTPDEVIKAFNDTDMYLIVLLGLWLGLRVSEIRGLKKSDFKNGELTINRVIVTVDNQPVEKTLAKTELSKRTLQVPAIIQNMVNETTGDYITTLSGERIYKKFKRRITKAGYPDCTFHDLRHLNASVMLMLNVPDKYAMERGGWSNTSVLKNVYQETFDAERKRVDAAVDAYFEQRVVTPLDTKPSRPPQKPRKFRIKRI